MPGGAYAAGTVEGVPNLDDDLDWLYRRGRYADDATGSSRVPVAATAGRSAAPVARPVDPRPVQPAQGTPAPPPASRPLRAPQPAPRPAPRPQTATPRPSGPVARLRLPRHPLRWLVALLLALVVYLVAVPLSAWSGLQHVDYAPDGNRPPQQPGTLILLSGSDSRDGLTSKQMHDLGTGSEGGNVADTIMLLYLPPSGRPALISIPRDSYLPIPGHGKNKINASFAMGGPKLLAQTIEQNTGLRIDGYLGIGFGGFVSIIDALGGIEQCPTTDVNDDGAHLYIKKGCQNMDGVTALKYVRYRHADPLGDLGRANRQRAMVVAVAKKAMTPLTVLNPFAYYGLNAAGASALKAGSDTGLPQIAPAALAFYSISKGDGLTITVPIGNLNLDTSNAGMAVQWDKTRAPQLFDQIAKGDTSQLDQFKK